MIANMAMLTDLSCNTLETVSVAEAEDVCIHGVSLHCLPFWTFVGR